jgi:hypothetical protein
LKAMWHVVTTDEVRLSEQLASLDAQQYRLELKIRAAVHRQRYSPDPADVAKAVEEEQSLLTDLDRVMTRIRAVEGQLALLNEAA